MPSIFTRSQGNFTTGDWDLTLPLNLTEQKNLIRQNHNINQPARTTQQSKPFKKATRLSSKITSHKK